jgi:hypothetical protein
MNYCYAGANWRTDTRGNGKLIFSPSRKARLSVCARRHRGAVLGSQAPGRRGKTQMIPCSVVLLEKLTVGHVIRNVIHPAGSLSRSRVRHSTLNQTTETVKLHTLCFIH